MRETPDIARLLEAVSALLRTRVSPLVDPATAFELKVAANAVDLAARASLDAGRADAGFLQAVETLLSARFGSASEANIALCEAIADRPAVLAEPALWSLLEADVLRRIAVDQPRYSAYRRRRDEPSFGTTRLSEAPSRVRTPGAPE